MNKNVPPFLLLLKEVTETTEPERYISPTGPRHAAAGTNQTPLPSSSSITLVHRTDNLFSIFSMVPFFTSKRLER